MSSWLVPIALISILILLNGLFVAAEFAIVRAPRASIEHKAAQGHRVAKLVSLIQRNPLRVDRYLATAQLGITLVSLGLGMYGEHVLAEWLAAWLEALGEWRWIGAHALASTIAVAILSFFHIVIGEMVPKAVALKHAEETALRVTRPMIWIEWLLFPLVWSLNGLGYALLKVFGINRAEASQHQYYTPEELEYIIRESQAGGLLRKESGDVLRELFDFGDLTAGEVMVPRVNMVGIPLGAGPEQVANILRRALHTRYPVYEGDLDHIVGVVHIRELLRCLLEGRAVQAADVQAVPFVPETATLDAVLAAMRQAQAQMAIVMDEHGGTAGLVSVEDLFEEVAGEVDEKPVSHPPIAWDQSGRLMVDGTVRLEDVGEALGVTLDHEEVDTVSGLVLSLLGRPPQVGDVVEYSQLRFEVIAVAGRGVKMCAVTPPVRQEVTDGSTVEDDS
ncbi:hemolysin family protein [Thermaerobacter subterraneus]|uniref:CBS domain-containing protein n=1 Tax=Thermaerobacter subterraneus DSM 13965 TaxID=867903 RepID=K6Q2N0_9FIRM|nr:hemolysin family protein [Thermaerobacter subterraneus]EKP95284.1 CBS domain-containing protein [Thermaerobacter subterraneus DSM 13965]